MNLLKLGEPECLDDMFNESIYLLKDFMESNKLFSVIYGPPGIGKTLSIILAAKEYKYDYQRISEVKDMSVFKSKSIFGNSILFHITDKKIFKQVVQMNIGSNKAIFESNKKESFGKKVFYIPYQPISSNIIRMISVIKKSSSKTGDLRVLMNSRKIWDKNDNKKSLLYEVSRWKIPDFIFEITEDSFYYLIDFWNEVKSIE